MSYHQDYYRSLNGLLRNIYSSQKSHSLKRKQSLPDYTSDEFVLWANTEDYKLIHKKWVESDYSKLQSPSFDRINDNNPYTFNNLQLTTWKENKLKGEYNRKVGIDNRNNKAVNQLSISGRIIKRFHSIREAERKTECFSGNICKVLNGEYNQTGGFGWQYASS
jgi:hypothetical protein